ncbi:hypothetical protein BDD12DRAFT_379227 [Trichophaea hybrida]|nr:hypothetical protein BDD12DRAFT_379227 [Trichophaea hybrida]
MAAVLPTSTFLEQCGIDLRNCDGPSKTSVECRLSGGPIGCGRHCWVLLGVVSAEGGVTQERVHAKHLSLILCEPKMVTCHPLQFQLASPMSPSTAVPLIPSHSTLPLLPATVGSFRYTLQSTTRQPLFVDPVAWTPQHFAALQIKVLPNCSLHTQVCQTPPSSVGIPTNEETQELPSGIHPPTLDEPSGLQDLLHPFDSRDLLDGSFSSTFIGAIRTCTFYRRQALFRVDFEAPPLAFRFGGDQSVLRPQQIVFRITSHCDVPFLAYNRRQGISQKRAKWQQLNRRYYGHRPRRIDGFFSAYEETPLEQPDPYDLAVLLALAQMQRDVLATRGSKAVYRTYVLASSSLSPQLALFSADIPASFLGCLDNPGHPVTEAPVIRCYRVPVAADGDEFLSSLSSVLAKALTDFPGEPVRQCKRRTMPADTDSNDVPKWRQKRLASDRSVLSRLA